MNKPVELFTERLYLRQWRLEDYPSFAQMNASQEVMKYYPKTLTEAESNAMASRVSSLIDKRGWGFWALEEKTSGIFIGFTGLHEVPESLPFSPSIEIGWRLSKEYWGKGYATEAAKAALDFAFNALCLERIVSFTSVINHKSQAVMKRIGMVGSNSGFLHPSIPEGSPLREHVLYTINRTQWLDINQPESNI